MWCLFSRDRRRALAPTVASAALTFLVGGLAYGFASYLRWIHNLTLITWQWGGNNGSLLGWMSKSFTASPYFVPVVDLPLSLISVIALGISGFVLAAVLWHAQRQDIDAAVASIAIASLWCSPLGWMYYGWIALPPMLVLWRDRRLNQALVLIGAAFLWFPPLFFTAVHRSWFTVTFASSYFWGCTAFLLAAVFAGPP